MNLGRTEAGRFPGALRAGASALALASLILTGLQGCATRPAAAPASLTVEATERTGRLLIKVDARPGQAAQTLSASFELSGAVEQGRLRINTPLGTRLAEAHWQSGSVRLVTADGEQAFDDLPSLTRAALGEEIPLAALFDWLNGRPWAGAPTEPTAAASDNRQHFAQLGWTVDASRLSADGLLEARRPTTTADLPAVLLRVRLDR